MVSFLKHRKLINLHLAIYSVPGFPQIFIQYFKYHGFRTIPFHSSFDTSDPVAWTSIYFPILLLFYVVLKRIL